MRWVRTRVLPEPAPARTSSGPSPCLTASRCGWLRPASRRSTRSAPGSVGAPRPSLAPRARSAASPPSIEAGAAGLSRRPKSGRCAAAASRRRPASPRRRRARRAALDFGDPLRQGLDRLGDRVREVDPVGVGALRAPAFDLDRVAGVADHGRGRRHVLDHHRVGAHLGAVAHRDRAEQLGAGADRDVVAQGRVSLAALKAGAAQRDPLVERHPPADFGGLADHHAGAVVDEELRPIFAAGWISTPVTARLT